MGRRFGAPKPFVPVGPSGEALVDYTIYDAARAGFSPAVLVVQKPARRAVEEHVGAFPSDVPVAVVEQGGPSLAKAASRRSIPWGTVHAVVSTAGVVDGAFGVVNGDDLYGSDTLGELARAIGSDPGSSHLVAHRWRNVVPPSGVANRGVCVVEDGWLRSIREVRGLDATADIDGDTLVSMNVWGFRPEAMQGFRRLLRGFVEAHRDDDAELALPDAVGRLLAMGELRVKVHPTDAEWAGLTFAEDLQWVRARLAALVAAGHYPTPLWPTRPT